MGSWARLCGLVLVALALAAWPIVAHAAPQGPKPKQAAPDAPPPPAAPIQPPQSADGDAYAHHMELGIRLFEDRNYDAAASEFQRAYEKRKKASPLINLALCYKGRFEYTKAIKVLERALADHADSIDEPAKIKKAVTEMKELLGTVQLTVSVTGVPLRVRLDSDALEPGAEQKPIEVSPGGHSITIEADGYATMTRAFRIASGDALELKFELASAEGIVMIETERENTSISINGDPLPADALSRRLPPGLHVVEIMWPGRRHTANFAISSGKTTKIKLLRNGELSIAGGMPKPPDTIKLPPVSGPYLLGLVDAGARVGSSSAPTYASSMRAGYRVTRIFGVEGELRAILSTAQYFPETEEDFGEQTDAPLLATQVRVNARVMSPSDLVRAIATFGVGYTYEALYAPEDEGEVPTGHGFCANVEPGLEVDLSGFIIGFHTPFAVSITGVGFAIEFSGGLQLGYGVW